MKVTIDNGGLFSLTAETAEDNNLLFSITNTKMQGLTYDYETKAEVMEDSLFRKLFKKATNELNTPNSVQMEPKLKQAKKKYPSTYVHKRAKYLKTCPVEGCEGKFKSVGVHMRMKHGIDAKTGELVDNFIVNKTGAVVPVSEPVVQLPDGKYRVLPKRELLPSV